MGLFPLFITRPYRNEYVSKMLSSLSKNISAYNNISSEWVCKNGWVLHANWENIKVNDKHQNQGESDVMLTRLTPTITYGPRTESYFEPLLNLIG